MKRITPLSICVILAFVALHCAGPYNTEEDRGQTLYTGKVDRALFDQSDLSWFREEYGRYLPLTKALDSIRGRKDTLDMIVFLGTWCGDTHRELPRFIKIIETENIPVRVLEYHALNRNKASGSVLPKAYGITRVPTFIFIKDGIEKGRIVETPVKSLEEDIAGMFGK